MKPRLLACVAAVLTACGGEAPQKPADLGSDPLRSKIIEAAHLAARAMLRNLVVAQAHLQALGLADENENGVGEYGTLDELTGYSGVRGGRKLDPPVVSQNHRRLEDGSYERAGYRLRVHLPPDPAAAESAWCAYAWPVERGRTGIKAFFVNQEGTLLATEDGDYSGQREPDAGAAFPPTADGITGSPAANATGGDGAVWEPAG